MTDHEPAVEPIAVIGLACRVPGARDAAEFWENLVSGVASIRLETREQQAVRGVSPTLLNHPDFVPAVAVLDDFEYFDAGFFGMSAREAELREPQHRLFLELCYTALEDAGYDPLRYPGDIGVYGGCGDSTYEWQHERRNLKAMTGAGTLTIALATRPEFLTTFASYKLNLRGPSLTVHTACSTSLVTLHLACEALRNGECDMALSGAASVDLPFGHGYPYVEDGIMSPDGRIRPFDATARGTVWGSGGGIVLLKRLSDALADGDHIRALVLGNAINNDGATKAGYTAPSEQGQVAVIAQALGVAEADPRSVSYVEAHGTGTQLGDPIEVAALTAAYGAGAADTGWCALGSVKPNVGHMGPAAGVASLIKTVLALEYGLIPPSLNYDTPNPRIDFEASPFYVSSVLSQWKSDGAPRRAGVSSFGMGGTNAHVILEEAPAARRRTGPWPATLLPLSARSQAALEVAAQRLADRLDQAGQAPDLADVSFTLRAGRREHGHRLAVVAADPVLAAQALRDRSRWITGTGPAVRGQAPRVALMFSGQGAQYAGMGRQLYQVMPVFREAVEECAGLLAGRVDLCAALLADGRDAEEALRQTGLAQPALFAVEYALARLWLSWGVEPEAMIGHSIGEYVAATLAGVFELPAALHVVAERGRLMQSMPPGAMLAVQLGESEVTGRLPGELSVAAVNGERTCVVAGPAEAVSRFAAELARDHVGSRPLRTSHAFHSAMMEPVLAEFAAVVAAAGPRAPARPFVSNVTGEWISAAQAADPWYWARHVREPVRFADGLRTLLAGQEWLLVECGPGRQLCGLAQLNRGPRALPSLPHRGDRAGDTEVVLAAAGRLWAAGAPVDLSSVGPRANRVPLPAYPWERAYYWIDPDEGAGAGYDEATALAGDRRPLASWFAVPAWSQLPPLRPAASSPLGRVLLFADAGARTLAGALARAGAELTVVRPGPAFAEEGPGLFTVRAASREDYDALLARLGAGNGVPERCVHAWALTDSGAEGIWASQDVSFLSLLSLVQALAGAGRTVRLDVLTAGTQDVTGTDLRAPRHATVLGIAKVAPLEMPWLTVRHIDLDPAAGWPDPGREELAGLVGELSGPVAAPAAPAAEAADAVTVALRGGRRWQRRYLPADLGPEPGPPDPGLREGGVYLITGGLGGIGITVAEDLATRVRARLILLTRSGLPPREEWDTVLAVHGPADRAGRAVAAIRRMEDAGAQVLVLAADVTDPAALARVRDAIAGRFGRLHGIVHAAGLPGGGMAEVRDRASAQAVLAPKLAGTLALREVFGRDELDFVVLCSSVTAVAGGFGQVDYCAANNFLDAFARAAGAWDAPVVSVNWGGWLEVGMAAEVAAPAAFRALQRGDRISALDHPLLTRRHDGDGVTPDWCSGVVSAETHWLLADHRIAGVPVLPGTGYLEAARAAFVAVLPAPSPAHLVELRDVAFTEPMAVPDGGRAELRVVFSQAAEGLDFQVVSVAGGRMRIHAQGSAAWVLDGESAPASLDAVRERCGLFSTSASSDGDRLGISGSGLLTFGPRWGSLREIRGGQGEELALLEATEAAAADLDRWPLHPALLDEATAFGSTGAAGPFLPLGYGRILIRGPIPARLWSHLRHRDSGTDEVRSRDITLFDEGGHPVVSISDFVLRRIDGTAVADTLRAESPGAGEQALAAASSPQAAIRPAEGAQCLRMILAGRPGPQVTVSVQPIGQVIASAGLLDQERIAEDLDAAALKDDAPRLAGGSYVAPRTDLEAAIARIWSEVLGGQIGIDDDFFDVGGNSLVAVQLVAMVRKELGVRLPMRSVFEAPTVAGAAALIDSMRGQQPPDHGETIPRLPRHPQEQ